MREIMSKSHQFQMPRTFTPEHREKLAAANRGKHHSPETRAKMRAAKLGKKKSAETRARMSAARIGVKYSDETRARMSAAKRGKPGRKLQPHEVERFVAWRTGREHDERTKAKMSASRLGVPCPHGRRETYKGVLFRSSWEVRTAKALDALGIAWEYEPQRFYFKGERFTYLPDFYLPTKGVYWEVKGWMRHGDAAKIAAFRQHYPQHALVIVNSAELRALERAAQKAVA